MDRSEYTGMDARQLAGLVQGGEVRAGDVVEAAIAVAEEVDPGLGALSSRLFDQARRQAGEVSGPFAGVPLVLKDAGQELAGSPHWAGVAALRDAGHRSRVTTGLAAALERLGFVILGKGAVPELSCGVTTEPPGFAPTRNPFAPGCTAGGSSGGSAVAVAAGIVPVAHGADATGSLRFPAAACGLVTLKPTGGRVVSVPAAGQQDPLGVWAELALCRHAADLTAVFTTLTGTSPAPAPGGLRVGLLADDPVLGLAPERACVIAVEAVGRALENLGHHVEHAWPAELGHLFAPIAAHIGLLADVTRHQQVRWVSRRLGRRPGPGDLSAAVLEEAARGARCGPDRRQAAARAVRARVAPLPGWWDDYDVLVTPAMRRVPWPLGEDAGPLHCGLFAAPFSLTGQPAYVARGGRDPVTGVPVGVQLVGRRGDDHLLLALGEQLDLCFPWVPPPGRGGLGR